MKTLDSVMDSSLRCVWAEAFGIPYGLPNCGPTAITLATGLPYEKVTETIANKVSKRPSRWKGRMQVSQITHALLELGVEFRKCYYFRDQDRLRVTEFARRLEAADDPHKYIVFVNGHFQLLYKGLIGDQFCVGHWSTFKKDRPRNWARNGLIHEVWVI